jgi:leucyl aminopeptidase (aminopeptidase T)
MDIEIGTEVRDEFLNWEVEAGARKLIEDIMLTRAGENVVISADTSSDMRVVQAAARAAYAAGAIPTVVMHPTQREMYQEPPAPVAGAITRADVWIEFAVGTVFLSEAWKQAIGNGVRYICLTGMDAVMMVKCIQRVRYAKLLELGNLLRDTVQAADKVEIYSPGGTELVAYNQGRKARQSGKLADTKGEAIMLGGQVSWCPMEETINGKLVFDAALYPPAELGKLSGSVELTLKKGVVTQVTGGTEAKIFERWLAGFNDPNMYRLAHYSLGFNPGVTKASGRIVEDERIFGSVEMGIGSQGPQIRGKTWKAAAHTDGVVFNPTIVLDGTEMEKDGVYRLDSLVRACRELGVPGY